MKLPFKLPLKLINKPYIRNQKTSLDRIMAGIALVKHMSGDYPPAKEIKQAFKKEKLVMNETIKEKLLLEFPGIELPELNK